MRALLLFYSKSGVRIAVQSYAPLFSALIAAIMLDMYPAALVRHMAAELFAPRPSPGPVFPLAALAFLLPAWAALRLAAGVNGWMRHLPLSGAAHRGGLTLALGIVQAPLAVGLVILAAVASDQHLAVSGPLARHLLVLAAGAVASLPVTRRIVVFPLGLTAAATAACGSWWAVPLSVPLLIAAERCAGPVRELRLRRPLRAAGTSFELRTAWRAVRWRVLRAYGAALAALGATALFASNNPMPGPLLSATVRFGGAFAGALFMAILAQQLAVRRPVWPWARSLPHSSGQRILSDALILCLAAVPLLVCASLVDITGALTSLSAMPLLSVRAAGHMRRLPERKTGSSVVLVEGFAIAAALALFSWSSLVWLAGVPAAFGAARRLETRQKVTRWLELHHTAAGDPMSWSG